MKRTYCDFCEKDLTHDHGCDDYRLNLVCEKLPEDLEAQIRFDVLILPILNTDYHFCGINCLGKWIEKDKND